MAEKRYFAHTVDGKDENEWQTLKSHAENVARQVFDFSKTWCSEEYAKNLGLLHDIGKYQDDFQRRLHGENIQVEHSICGAAEWLKLGFPESGAYCIAGHHTGMPDIGNRTDSEDEPTLLGRLKRVQNQGSDYSAFRNEIEIFNVNTFPAKDAVNIYSKDVEKEYAFWTRMMFSCLTDADYIDTESACGGSKNRGVHVDFRCCLDKLNKHINGFAADSPVKAARDSLRRQVMSHVDRQANIYLLNMPTGSGKTLTSMQFALERAVKGHKEHIICVIPYTSIIEQNAKVFKDIFGENAVLEHHCDFDYDAVKDERVREKLKRTAENWDASIIVTTNVQFFESIYGNRSAQLRKLHNIANSIIIFDEVHMFPSLFFQPCLEAIKILTTRYNCEAVFMTATMPDFHVWMQKFGCDGVDTLDLITDKHDFPVFSRCSIENLGVITKEKLISLAQSSLNALIVVNSRKAAKEIYRMIPYKKFHLSTYITHDDRSAVIKKVNDALKNKEHFCLVSTSLIEAGVDLDFDIVFRELAGLDNLLQTAGRCNREGKKSGCKTYSFEFEEDELRSRNTEFNQKQSFCKNVFEKYQDVTSEKAIEYYFDQLYEYTLEDMTSIDFGKAITTWSCGVDSMGFNFASYAKKFKLIDENTIPLVIVNDKNREVVLPLLKAVINGGIVNRRRLQQYTVSLREYEFRKLNEAGVICDANGIKYLDNERFYNSETGICFENNNATIW